MQDGPLRTLLFVPATRPEWLAKAAAAGTDACVIDLEDSVPESVKAQARAQAPGMLSEAKRIGLPAFVRINATTTAHWLAEVIAELSKGVR